MARIMEQKTNVDDKLTEDKNQATLHHEKVALEVFYKTVLTNFRKFRGKHLTQSLFFNKVRPATLLKKRLWHRCFPLNFLKFVRTPFLQKTSGRLLLICDVAFFCERSQLLKAIKHFCKKNKITRCLRGP